MRNLVIGASGQVGSRILSKLQKYYGSNSTARTTYGTTWSQERPDLINLDISNRVQVFSVIRETKPEVIYLTSAMTNVDACEFNPIVSLPINVAGVKNVVDAIDGFAHKVKLVYFSTDYVFDGERGPYYVYDICNPINEYGKHKLAAENYVLTYAKDPQIIRTCGVFSASDQKNFASRLVESIKKGEPIKIVSDQFGSPTYAHDLASAAIHLSESNSSRTIVHVSNNVTLSRFEFAKKIASHFDAVKLIEPIETREIKQEAKRPMKSGLHCSVEVRRLMRSLDDAIAEFARYKQEV